MQTEEQKQQVSDDIDAIAVQVLDDDAIKAVFLLMENRFEEGYNCGTFRGEGNNSEVAGFGLVGEHIINEVREELEYNEFIEAEWGDVRPVQWAAVEKLNELGYEKVILICSQFTDGDIPELDEYFGAVAYGDISYEDTQWMQSAIDKHIVHSLTDHGGLPPELAELLAMLDVEEL